MSADVFSKMMAFIAAFIAKIVKLAEDLSKMFTTQAATQA